ncbi:MULTISPECIES: M15 family metallopeptidase [unclassified Janthinobacterium]|uniref:M15 family metallopeptidase n=1 Tax=unclassified Janthinobacterium TaxID=2610881 RepID=UPI0016091F36|nr:MULTISPECIES: M15 family metallopeptidase [unclassified Janthinobacterium]MBB5610127.1 peptidoglycan L-alanyl-D-glutamate endopeptidase CwlK [Janthinobacterium sp. S3T4]MBB5615523.1 peptidoglycan L-alanyl-D-glutamate endopeptidase CwlK [Janthinobacterium sp. S3M3]
MFIALVLMYFLLACFACWIFVFPAGRALLLQAMVNLGWRLQRRAQRLQHGGGAQWQRLQRDTGSSLVQGWRLLLRHRWLSLAGALLIVTPPLLAWLSSDRIALRGYSDQQHAINEQVSDLLRGEQLVPPPTLPPLFFTTTEVTQLRPMLDGASRNWQLLDHDYAQRLLLVFKIMKEMHGYDMVLLEGYRSPARQNLLAAAGPQVTNAKAFQSYHQYGLAADCAFMHEGKLIISEKNAWAMRGYHLYGVTAESVGLRWGGRWTMMDFGHTELRQPGVLGK